MEKLDLTKTNSSYRFGCYHVGRSDMWGWYCPETGEHFLRCNDEDPVIGAYIATLCMPQLLNDGFEQYDARGYSYEVVRELLQLGHLTSKTLARFLEAGGDVWWDQPNL